MQLGIGDLDLRWIDEVGGRHHARTLGLESQRDRLVAVRLQAQLLQVEQQLGRVLLHARDRRELVVDALDPHGGDGGARHRGQQHAPQRVAQRQTKTTFQWVNLELGVVLRLLNDFYLSIQLFEQFGALRASFNAG